VSSWRQPHAVAGFQIKFADVATREHSDFPGFDIKEGIAAEVFGDRHYPGPAFSLFAIGRIGTGSLAQTKPDELCRTLSFASSCAAFTCGRAGADPPRQSDVSAGLSRLSSDLPE
jgi:fructokinase